MNLKDYSFNTKENFIDYLRHIIIVSVNSIKRYEIQLHKLDKFIQKEGLIDNPKATVEADIYEEYKEMLSYSSSYLLNIIGDHAKFGTSYQNYRKNVEKKSKELQIDYCELSEEEKAELNRVTTARDWSSHIPASLIHSTKRNVIKEKEIRNLIDIPDFQYYEAEWIISLFDQNNSSLDGFKKILELMKKDYTAVTKSPCNIVQFKIPVRTINDLIIPKISWDIQSKKINTRDEIKNEYLKGK